MFNKILPLLKSSRLTKLPTIKICRSSVTGSASLTPVGVNYKFVSSDIRSSSLVKAFGDIITVDALADIRCSAILSAACFIHEINVTEREFSVYIRDTLSESLSIRDAYTASLITGDTE